MTAFKILVCDPLSPKGVTILSKECQVDEKPKLPEEEIIKIIPQYDGVIVRSGTKITEKIITAASKLKVIGRAGVGVDNIDVKAATKKGIVVLNSPEGNTRAAAEQTLALLFSVMRKTPQAYISMKEKRWDRKKFMGSELYNKKFGIVGLGKIGTAVAKMALGIGMQVYAYDPFADEEMCERLGITFLPLEKLFKEVDIISLHVPKNDDTKDLINTQSISKMKKGIIIINCARGGVVNEDDLY
ncbi:hydroxyacid dehydrogenase, partial [Candidatus Margulisiibacteriota bacterium]